MKVIVNRWIPWKGFYAINLFGILFVRKEYYTGEVPEKAYNHEAIHTAQMKELGYLGFYILYILEWFLRLFLPGNSYHQVSFEREAYLYQWKPGYLKTRKHYAQWRNGG